jgi:hypothetical protein
MADLWNNALVDPPFASNPPLKVNVPAKTYGLVVGILAAIGAILSLFVMIGAFTVSSALSSFDAAANAACNADKAAGFNVNCTIYSAGGSAIAGIGALIVLAAMCVGAWGGFQMYQGIHRGRALMVYGLVGAAFGWLIYAILWGFGVGITYFIVDLIIYAVIYYFLVISKFPDEVPLVAAAAPAGYPPYGPPPNYPQPPQGPYPPQGQGPYPPQGPPQS